MANGFKGLGKTLIIGGIGAVVGYLKCMSDVAEQQGEIEVKPAKHSNLTMRKVKKEEKES